MVRPVLTLNPWSYWAAGVSVTVSRAETKSPIVSVVVVGPIATVAGVSCPAFTAEAGGAWSTSLNVVALTTASTF